MKFVNRNGKEVEAHRISPSTWEVCQNNVPAIYMKHVDFLAEYDLVDDAPPEPPPFCTSPTGGKKDVAGKPRYDLVPIEFIEGAARVFEFGAEKYSEHNWRKGIPTSMLIRSLLSHTLKFNAGEDNDPESGLSHLDHACASLAMLIATVKTMPEQDDRFKTNATLEQQSNNEEGRV